jgi:hypothetical protein
MPPATKTVASGDDGSKREPSPEAPAPIADDDDDSDWEALQSSGDRAPSPAGPAQPAPQLTAEERLRKIELDKLRREADETKARREEERRQIAAAGVKILSKAERRQRKEEEERLRLVKLQRRRVRMLPVAAGADDEERPGEDGEAGLKAHRAEVGEKAAAAAGNTQADREARRQARVEALPEPDLALPIRTNLHAMRTGLSFLTSEHRGLRHVQNPQGLPTNAMRQEMPPWSRPPTEVFIKNVGVSNVGGGNALDTALRLDAMSRRLAEHPYDIPWLEERGHRGIFRRQRAERSIGHIRATMQKLFTSDEPIHTRESATMSAIEAGGTVPVPVPSVIARLAAAAKRSVESGAPGAPSTAGTVRPSPSTAPALPATVQAIMARLQGKNGARSGGDEAAAWDAADYAPSKRGGSPASTAVRSFAPPVPKAVARLAAAAANSRPAVKVVKLHPPEEHDAAAGKNAMAAPLAKADHAPPLPPASAAKFTAKVKAQKVAVESAMAKAQSLAEQTDATAMAPPDTPSGAGGHAEGRHELPPPPARRGKRVRNPAPLLEP